ncbi:MAG: AmmeMemoRadiSam system protein B [Anaerolineae bacterium]
MRRALIWTLVGLLLVACRATPSTGPGLETLIRQSPTPLPSPSSPNPTPRSQDIHFAEGADRWYPGDPDRLRASVEAFLEQAHVQSFGGQLLAVVVPHAGYVYAGTVAGYAFRALREAGCAEHTIAVIGDTHTGNGSAEIAVWAAGAFETPLGHLPVDELVAQALLAADSRVQFDHEAFRSEHPIENQLPFIQIACPGARIVPIVVREPSLENAKALADALVRALSSQPALLVASTDLSHYHPYTEAQQIDQIALQAIISLDPQVVLDSPRRCAELGLGGEPLTMCSPGTVMTTLFAVRQMGADQATILHYATSGDVPLGDRTQVVGYGAVAFWRSHGRETPTLNPVLSFSSLPPNHTLPLYSAQQKELLTLARQTVAHFLVSQAFPSFETSDPALLQPLGAYVTYHAIDHATGQRTLRGCLGRLEADRPVYLNVQYAAVAAALADPRFPPVTLSELDELTLEITLLEPMHPVSSPDQLQIGREGVLMQIGKNQRALFLPQVPLQEGWDLSTTLMNLCRKAGLSDDCWQRPDARFYGFEGQWFGEE